MKAESVQPLILKLMLRAHSDFQPLTRKERADSHTRMTFRSEMIRRRKRGKVGCIVQSDALVHRYAASEHQSVVASCSNRKN
jgi:hypothetical protein